MNKSSEFPQQRPRFNDVLEAAFPQLEKLSRDILHNDKEDETWLLPKYNGSCTLNGIPVIVDKNLRQRIKTKTKRWKRQNRPDKVRTRKVFSDYMYIINNTIYVSPSGFERLQKGIF